MFRPDSSLRVDSLQDFAGTGVGGVGANNSCKEN